MKKASAHKTSRRSGGDMRAEYEFDYSTAKPNRFASRVDRGPTTMSVSTQEGNFADSDYYFLPIVVHLRPAVNLSDEQLFDLCQVNRELRIERDVKGDLVILPLTGGETSIRNSEINMQLRIWTKRDGTGKAFDSSGGFRLPNGAMRSPDAAWLALSRWKARIIHKL
jgi:hypothetical protein